MQAPLPRGRLGEFLVITSVLHAILLLAVSFDLSPPPRLEAERFLDVTLTRPEPASKPEQADFLAPADSAGGGEKPAEPAREAAPASPPAQQQQQSPQPAETPPQSAPTEQAPQQQLLTTPSAPSKVPQAKPKQPASPAPAPDIARLLAATQQEISALTADLDRRARASASRTRRKAVSAATQEFRYAAYLDSWRRKVETIGNLNYPDEARRQKLFGNLLLHVAVRSDGSVEKIRVIRSSGHQVLDDAAKRIVRLAAPFAPFPPDIREEVDVLDITRTWQFLDNNRLFSAD
jgi:protein TonB